MDDPKPPKPKTQEPEGLAEVERAISVLHGRHPDAERTRREDDEKLARRIAEQEAVHSNEVRRVRTKQLTMIGGVGAIVIVAITIAGLFRTELGRRARLELAGDPYRAMGFSIVETSGRGDPEKLEAEIAPGCVLATATSAKVKLKVVASSGAPVEGLGPIVTCVCEGGRITVTADASTMRPGDGIALLRADASAIGGSRAFPFLPFVPGATGRNDQACAEASLDAWLDARKWVQNEDPADSDAEASPSSSPSPSSSSSVASSSVASVLSVVRSRPNAGVDEATSAAWFAAKAERAELHAVGFKVTDIVRESTPFGIVDIAAGSCVLIVPASPSDRPTLRLKGNVIAIGPSDGTAVWCTSSATLAILQRGGESFSAGHGGEIALLVAPADKTGGLFGAREIAERAGLGPKAVGLPSSDYGWSSKQLLLSSAIPDTLITTSNTPNLGAEPDARIVAFTSDRVGAVVPDTPPEVFSYCDPPIVSATVTVCVFSGPQKWRVEGADATAGLARAKLPFWLFGFQNVSEPAALRVETMLVGLARRLKRQGFEPTTIEGVTELDRGAEILGRAKEDAFVAVSTAPVAPWVFPYTDGPPWSLDEGEPRIVPINPLERITVTSAIKLPPKGSRHTIVFRRQK